MHPPRSRTLPALLDEMAERYPDRPFVVDRGKHLTYAEFRANVRHLARGLHALGVRKGDKVAVLMGNSAEWLSCTFAATLIGATFVALNTWWRHNELAYALELSDAKVLIIVDRYVDRDYVQTLHGIDHRAHPLPLLEQVVCLTATQASHPDMISYQALLKQGDAVDDAVLAETQRNVGPGDIALLLFTSGSTARPKAVQNQHRPLIENLFSIGERLRLTESDRVLVSISLFWGFGIANAVFAIMTHGACIVLQHRFDAGEALALIEKEQCTALYATPNIALAMSGHPDRGCRDLSSLRTGLGMPAAVPALVALGAHQACSLYGLTECYGNSAVSDAAESFDIRTKTCGRPLPSTELVIADPSTHVPLAVGMTGEIKLRGYVMPGYYKDAAKTAECFDPDGFFLTGDLGMVDDAGYLHFRGRLKEIVKTGGITVSPAEVEEVLRGHSGVDQAIVVGIPDPVRDEVLAAAVVARANVSVNTDELHRFCKERLAQYKVPRHFEVIALDQLPLTDTGKPDRRGLRQRLAEKFAGRG